MLRWLRRILIWAGPIVVLLVLVCSSFLYWVLATPSGSRWVMHTAAQQLDGEVSGVEGTIWEGLTVGDFAVSVPGVAITLKQFHLQANWRELLRRRLHVQDLSAGAVSVALTTTPNEAPSEPFSMPVLPLTVTIDRFAVDELAVSQDGEPLPVSIGKLNTSLALGQEGAQLVIQSLNWATNRSMPV